MGLFSWLGVKKSSSGAPNQNADSTGPLKYESKSGAAEVQVAASKPILNDTTTSGNNGLSSDEDVGNYERLLAKKAELDRQLAEKQAAIENRKSSKVNEN